MKKIHSCFIIALTFSFYFCQSHFGSSWRLSSSFGSRPFLNPHMTSKTTPNTGWTLCPASSPMSGSALIMVGVSANVSVTVNTNSFHFISFISFHFV